MQTVRTKGFISYLGASLAYYDRTAVGDIVNTLTVETTGVIAALGPIELVLSDYGGDNGDFSSRWRLNLR